MADTTDQPAPDEDVVLDVHDEAFELGEDALEDGADPEDVRYALHLLEGYFGAKANNDVRPPARYGLETELYDFCHSKVDETELTWADIAFALAEVRELAVKRAERDRHDDSTGSSTEPASDDTPSNLTPDS